MDFENDFGTQFGASHHNIIVLGDSPSIEFRLPCPVAAESLPLWVRFAQQICTNIAHVINGLRE